MVKAILLVSLVSAVAYAAQPIARQADCADVTVIFARGTGEIAPIGTIVGPPFQSALQSALGSQTLSFQGVNYAASVQGFLEGGDPQGAATMASDITAAAASCPSSAIVMSGYSQGAQLVHLAAAELTTAVQNRVDAVVMFGDPDDGKALPGTLNSKSLTFCAQGDDICEGGDIITAAHLSYGANTPAAATFVVSKI